MHIVLKLAATILILTLITAIALLVPDIARGTLDSEGHKDQETYLQGTAFKIKLRKLQAPKTSGHARSFRSWHSSTPYYIYEQAPPAGFAEWVAFAKEKGCMLEEYDKIEQDLKPFRAAGITRDMIREAAQQEEIALFRIRNGTVTYTVMNSNRTGEDPAAVTYHTVLSTVSQRLPDMDFAVNCADEPRVLVGEGTASDRLARTCDGRGAHPAARFAHLHGYFICGWQPLVGRLLPVFSQSKIDGCFADITVPSWMNAGVQPASQDDLPPWEDRMPSLFFRGTSTGGRVEPDTPHQLMHRQRLMQYARNRTDMDIGFVEYLQCEKQACWDMEKKYGVVLRAPEEETWRHKYIMILDGNTFSSRLMKSLTSGSLIFRAGLFTEWFDERLRPFVHYLPVRLDFADLQSRLDWARAHDKQAHAIAEQAALQAKLFIRYEDMQCYWYRLLLEYATLLK